MRETNGGLVTDPQLEALARFVRQQPQLTLGLAVVTGDGSRYRGILVSSLAYLKALRNQAWTAQIGDLLINWEGRAQGDHGGEYLHLLLAPIGKGQLPEAVRLPSNQVVSWSLNDLHTVPNFVELKPSLIEGLPDEDSYDIGATVR